MDMFYVKSHYMPVFCPYFIGYAGRISVSTIILKVPLTSYNVVVLTLSNCVIVSTQT